MVGSGDQVILGRAQQMPVTYVYRWFSRFPVVAFAKAETGIHLPADLAGKKIGVPGAFGASWIGLLALLDAGGLTTDDVQIEAIGFTQAAAISEGLVDVATDYAVNGPIVLAQADIPTTQIAVNDYLIMPANGIVTNETTIAEHPELVHGIARALAKSVAWTLANPDEAFAIALQVVPEAGGEKEAANRAVFDASLPIWSTAEGATPGATSLEEWSQATDFLLKSGIITTRVDPAALFTNDFLPE
jgi:NitT/TauT family transport system substrate-binding protein